MLRASAAGLRMEEPLARLSEKVEECPAKMQEENRSPDPQPQALTSASNPSNLDEPIISRGEHG